MPNTPVARPDVEGIEARLLQEGEYSIEEAPRFLAHARQDIPALIAWIEKLEAQKWDVQHTDAMNDMVALGIDRDSWKARAEELEARQVKLEAVVREAPLCHACEGWMPGRCPICGDYRKALAELGGGDG